MQSKRQLGQVRNLLNDEFDSFYAYKGKLKLKKKGCFVLRVGHFFFYISYFEIIEPCSLKEG